MTKKLHTVPIAYNLLYYTGAYTLTSGVWCPGVLVSRPPEVSRMTSVNQAKSRANFAPPHTLLLPPFGKQMYFLTKSASECRVLHLQSQKIEVALPDLHCGRRSPSLTLPPHGRSTNASGAGIQTLTPNIKTAWSYTAGIN